MVEEDPEATEEDKVNYMNDDEIYNYFTEIDMKEHKKKHGLD